MTTFTKEESFRNTIEEIAARDRSRQRIALALTVALIVAAGCWLGVSALQVRKLDLQSVALAKANGEIEAHIRTGNEILAALIPLLKDFGWDGAKIPKDLKDINRIKRSVEADDQLTRLRLESRPPQARSATIEYFQKDVDGLKVEAALREFGLKFSEKPPLVPDVPANDVVFGDDVPPENAKIVAYVLIRAGVDIKGIHLSNIPSKAHIVQVIASRIAADEEPLSPDSISLMSSFDRDPAGANYTN
jgi:hypothetical protein